MFDCEVRLDITLSEKRCASAHEDFKVVVGIKLAGGEDGGNWHGKSGISGATLNIGRI